MTARATEDSPQLSLKFLTKKKLRNCYCTWSFREEFSNRSGFSEASFEFELDRSEETDLTNKPDSCFQFVKTNACHLCPHQSRCPKFAAYVSEMHGNPFLTVEEMSPKADIGKEEQDEDNGEV